MDQVLSTLNNDFTVCYKLDWVHSTVYTRKVRAESTQIPKPIHKFPDPRMIFATVPNDVLLIIRSYLFIFRVKERDVEELETFLRQESERSWRNFLSASNSESWKVIRKETRIWSFNERNFRKYLSNDLFRQYVNERMVNSVQQLRCCLYTCGEETCLISFSSLVMEMSNIGCINILQYNFSDFPSSRILHTLSLGLCSALERIGEFPNLDTLSFIDVSN
jgi:hypothetical protein